MTTSPHRDPSDASAEPDMTTGHVGLDDYLRSNAGDAGLLGSVVLMSVGASEDPVTHDELAGWFTELELDPAFLPNPPRAVDAYERATAAVKAKYPIGVNPLTGRKKQTHEKTGQTITLMMRHVVRDETRVVRHLVRELADHADEALSYEVCLAEAGFDRTTGAGSAVGSGDMTVTTIDHEIDRLGVFERVTITGLIEAMRADFDNHCRYIAGTRLSKMLRDYLEDGLDAIRLQSGVYFVPRQFHNRLLGVRELAGRVGAALNRIPLPDTAEQRSMVGEAFNAKCGADLDSLTRDIAREKSAGAVAYRVTKLHKRFLTVQREARQYQDNLGAELGDTSARLDLITAQMASLFAAMATTDPDDDLDDDLESDGHSDDHAGDPDAGDVDEHQALEHDPNSKLDADADADADAEGEGEGEDGAEGDVGGGRP